MSEKIKIEIGDIFENLQVIENLGLKTYCGKNCTFYKCKCLKCGNTIDVPRKNLGKVQKDCGCWRREPRKPLPKNSVWGRLKVIGIKMYDNSQYKYICKCGCEKGTIVEADRNSLVYGYTKSCGCLHDELFQEKSKKAKEKMFIENTNPFNISSTKISANNKSGVKGVSWHKGIGKWQARIQFQGGDVSFGILL